MKNIICRKQYSFSTGETLKSSNTRVKLEDITNTRNCLLKEENTAKTWEKILKH